MSAPFRETAFQGATFLALLLAGALSALLCDALRLPVRRSVFPLRLLMDAACCCCAAFLCFLALEATEAGALRPYMALAFALGAALYAQGVRKPAAFVIKTLRGKRKSAPGGE